MKKLWKNYEPMIEALVELFTPFVEIAVHDLEKGTLAAIYNNISQRKVGEPSPIKELKVKTEEFPPYFAPYYKTNWDGRPLKCTSITLRNAAGKAVGLICINIDVSFFQEGARLIERFLATGKEAENPVEIHGSDAEEQIESIIYDYVEKHHLKLDRLTRMQKKELVQELYRKGVFNFKNAAPFVAANLGISRATIYNHLRG